MPKLETKICLKTLQKYQQQQIKKREGTTYKEVCKILGGNQAEEKTPNRKRIVQIVGFSAPGIHGVTHFWNELTRIWTTLMGSLKNRHSSKKKIQKWLTYRRTVLLPKGEEISNKGVYPPITGLNLSYKIYTGIV